MDIKRCNNCGRFLGENQFPWRNKKRGIKHLHCKKCKRVLTVLWALDNKKKIKEYQKQWYQKNKNKVKLRVKQYSQEHKENTSLYKKRWRQKNKDRVKQWGAKRRACKMNAEGSYSIEDLKYIYDHQQGKCPCCKKYIPFDKMTVDHIVPLTWGGSNYPSNIQLLCLSCNSSKGNRHATDYRDYIPLFLGEK